MTLCSLTSKINPGLSILVLFGRLDVQSVEEIGEALNQAVETCDAGLILDMGDVVFVSSAGLRVLLIAYKQAAAGNKKIGMIRVTPDVYKIFKITALDLGFNISKDEAEAVKVLS